jgi:intracellular septation protein A
MNPLSVILDFLPFIAFSVMSGRVAHNGAAWAALVAFAIAVALVAVKRSWPPKMMDVFQAVLFGVVAIVGFVGGDSVDAWLFDWANGLVLLALGLLILLFVPFMPFTEQYARETVPQEYWGSPIFKKVNRNLSLAWGVALSVMGVSSLAVALLHTRADSASDANALDMVLNWVVPIAVIVYMVRFTRTYPDKVRAEMGAGGPEQPAST